MIPSVDVAIPIGQVATVKPMVGYCTSTGGDEGLEEDSEIVFGAGMQIGRYSYEFEGFSDSGSDSDPFGFVGVMFGAGNIGIQTGIEIKKGDDDTDFALNAALSIPMGG